MAAIRVFDLLEQDALTVEDTPFGRVGTVFSDAAMEAVWVSKQAEEVDPSWFTQTTVDLILVLKGNLRVEFADPEYEPRTLEPGNLLVLPPETPCRAYRWPRSAEEPTVFLAVYPQRDAEHRANG